jgi:hypothetical protein
VSEETPSAEERAARAEEALREALEERNRLWQELQERRATEQDLAYWRGRSESIEGSRWWRLGAPLRLLKRVLADPATALSDAAGALRERRRG